MAPCDLERRETVGDISISMYRIWQNCGGGYDIVARRSATELKRAHVETSAECDELLATWYTQYQNWQIALRNAMHYEGQAADALAEAEHLSGDHKAWAIKDAQFFTDNAAFCAAQAAEIASR